MKNFTNTMIRFAILSLCIIVATGLYGQNKSKKTTTTKTTKTTTTKTETKTEPKAEVKPETKQEPGTLKNHGPEIQKVIKSENGVVRGYDFGTAKQKIKDTEDAEYVADGRDFMIYNVKVNEKEKAEVIYYFDENDKVKGFGIAFLVNANTLATDLESTLVDDFQKYFNERYGNFRVNEKNDEVWVAKDGSYTVEMGDSSEDASMMEIEIEIFKK